MDAHTGGAFVVKGTIIRIWPTKGFAHVRDEEGMTRFAHCRDFKPLRSFDTAHEGMAVEFKPIDEPETPKHNGLKAVEVVCCN